MFSKIEQMRKNIEKYKSSGHNNNNTLVAGHPPPVQSKKINKNKRKEDKLVIKGQPKKTRIFEKKIATNFEQLLLFIDWPQLALNAKNWSRLNAQQ